MKKNIFKIEEGEIKQVGYFDYMIYLNGKFLIGAEQEGNIIETELGNDISLELFKNIKVIEFPDNFSHSYYSGEGKSNFFDGVSWTGIKKENNNISLQFSFATYLLDNPVFTPSLFIESFLQEIKKLKKINPTAENYFYADDYEVRLEKEDGIEFYYTCGYNESTVMGDILNSVRKEIPPLYKNAGIALSEKFINDFKKMK